MTDAISIHGLSKSFSKGYGKRFVALDDVSFSVQPGEAFGFIGQNGAGKSTTIKVLTGALRQDAGEAALFGTSVGEHGSRRGVGYVPESPWLYDYLTPMEILKMGVAAHVLPLRGNALRDHCHLWLERFGLDQVANKVIRGFSKGMVQRTALAHALACQPRLLILDEPLSGLDPLGRREVVEILLNYRQEGGTIFFSSHVLHDVERLAHRVGLIHRGKLRTIKSPAELLNQDDHVLIRYAGSKPLPGAEPETAGRWSMEISRRDTWQVLDALRAAGDEVIEVRPALSLERAFIRFVAEFDAESNRSPSA
ncbi:ABC transporter ATP-binding protein [Chitinimonas sp. BJYL2]|uniref:ABC transporter ATP-binding protein n=1 Tax=Chitinimonas sp. BJYL2 TaxID=2976696 RepID=UPI0022B3AE21|nr:ABC transporter ATP-binding protein [Chitinimonas sp. BJYL2]